MNKVVPTVKETKIPYTCCNRNRMVQRVVALRRCLGSLPSWSRLQESLSLANPCGPPAFLTT